MTSATQRPIDAPHRKRVAVGLAGLTLLAGGLSISAPAGATGGSPPNSGPASRGAATTGAPAGQNPAGCAPSGVALGFSDTLDKLDVDGVRVGGLSSLAYDSHRHAWASTVDNHESDPSRIWFTRDLTAPRVVGPPLVLRAPDGAAYTGETADNEGLAVLDHGRFAVSSETEPSIRIFSASGRQLSRLSVPARFAVTGTTPRGESTANATLEALTLTPDGKHLIAMMEGALSGDTSAPTSAAAGDATMHRALVYTKVWGHGGGHWRLDRQFAYRADAGLRVPEVAAYGRHGLLVMEATYDPAVGNVVKLFAVDDWRGRDVSAVRNLSSRTGVAVHKRLVADLGACPTLGATAKQTQANPLLDNYEAMAITSAGHGWLGVSVLSDDNFNPTQVTRMLNLVVRVGH